MNADSIYQLQRDDAFADQFSAREYQTFVAMPFSNRGGYPETRIKSLLLDVVHQKANELVEGEGLNRQFAPLHRVDGGTAGAVVITDEIVHQILSSHFFLGDLTGTNNGVVLEAGIALALKPNRRVLLVTQDDPASLHFDLKVTNVNQYAEDNLVEVVAKGLVSAAVAFEDEADKYVRFLSSQLTPDAIMLLNIYGRMWKDLPKGSHPSIFAESVEAIAKQAEGKLNHFLGKGGRLAFYDCVRELSARRLFWTHYNPNVAPGIDNYGIHATKLGWRVIERIWQHDPQMREPEDAPTGPNI